MAGHGAKLTFIFESDHFGRLNAGELKPPEEVKAFARCQGYSLHQSGHLTLCGVRAAFTMVR
jgi:hypothetical protein